MLPPTWTSKIHESLSLLDSVLSPLNQNLDPFCVPPVLARHPPNTRHSVSSGLRESEQALRAVISSIDELRLHVDDLGREVARRRARCVNACSPVLALPADILRDIFAIVAMDDSENHPAIYLSHVCSAWRELCFSHRQMWSTISIPMHPQCQELYAEQSSSGGLDVICRDDLRWTCSCSRCQNDDSSILPFEIGDGLRTRVRSVTIDITVSSPDTQFVKRKLDDVFYNLFALESVDVRLHHPFSQTDFSRFTLYGDEVPRLRSLNLLGVAVDWGTKADAPRDLTITLPLRDQYVETVLDQMASCGNLESLHLRSSFGLGDDSPSLNTLSTVHLPSLRKLSLAFMDRPAAAALLKLINARSLQTLELCEIEVPPLGSIIAMLSGVDPIYLVRIQISSVRYGADRSSTLSRAFVTLAGRFRS